MGRMRMTAWLALTLTALSAQAEPVALDGDAITALVKGKRLAGQRAGGAVRLRFADDGALSVQDGHDVLAGRWSVEDGRLCLKLAKWNVDGCGRVLRADDGTHVEAADGRDVVVLGR